jgi:predicted SprT family Zn-dependent metalloprotease
MSLVSAKVLSDPASIKCRCGAEPRLVQKIPDLRLGGSLRIYRCAQCGEQTFVHPPE